jgi:tyrosyl-tRNA synthetase
MTTLSPHQQLEQLRRGTVEIITESALLEKLEQRRPLRVKLGLDPTAPDIHIGNAVVLHKLRQFQDLGHEAILVIGDFTGLIGDPSGKSETRPALSPDEVQRNAATYRDQYSLILDPARTRVVFNSEWLRPMTFYDVIRLASRATVHRLLERDDFAKRFREHLPIHLHELLYPLCQAYDSVAIRADVELGGTDQKFNNLMGRELQRELGQDPQVVVLTPLLPGLDGVQKMSKSLGNAIGITEPAGAMYGKVMSLADSLMIPYFEYCTPVPLDEIRGMEQALRAGDLHPRDAKQRLASAITARYHGDAAARAAADEFTRVFREHELPASVPARVLSRDTLRSKGALDEPNWVRLEPLLVELGFAASNSDARRLIRQGGVGLQPPAHGDGDTEQPLRLPHDASRLISLGVLEDLGKGGFRVCVPDAGPGGSPPAERSGLLVRVGRRQIARIWLGA